MTKRFAYLPSGYRHRKMSTVEGRAKTGEISPKGLVAKTESWDGRIAADVSPAAIRYIRDPDGTIRPMTFAEMVERGYFVVGHGPSNVRSKGLQT